MARGRAIDPEVRAIIEGAILAGLAIADIARKYTLPESTVRTIKKGITPDRFAESRGIVQIKLDELLLDALAANLKAQRAICEVASEPEYLRSQTSADTAKLYETLADSAVRLLEAKSYGESDGAEGG